MKQCAGRTWQRHERCGPKIVASRPTPVLRTAIVAVLKLPLENPSMVGVNLVSPWHAPSASAAQSLIVEAEEEIAADHPLKGMINGVLARSSASDDVLFELTDGRVANVHLTWIRKPEQSPWPGHTIFSNV